LSGFLKTGRARAHNILLEPAGAAIEDLLLVKEGVGIGERGINALVAYLRRKTTVFASGASTVSIIE
jgi:hypothetical protein